MDDIFCLAVGSKSVTQAYSEPSEEGEVGDSDWDCDADGSTPAAAIIPADNNASLRVMAMSSFRWTAHYMVGKLIISGAGI